jgi:hypothetical protein
MANTKRTTAKAKGAASSSSGRRPAAGSASTPARPAARRPAPAATKSAGKGERTSGSSGGSSAARTRLPIPTEPSPVEEIVLPTLSPMELYRQEKQRRSRTVKTEADPLAEARREYLALLAAEAEKGKGGRPKGSGKKKEEPVEDD